MENLTEIILLHPDNESPIKFKVATLNQRRVLKLSELDKKFGDPKVAAENFKTMLKTDPEKIKVLIRTKLKPDATVTDEELNLIITGLNDQNYSSDELIKIFSLNIELNNLNFEHKVEIIKTMIDDKLIGQDLKDLINQPYNGEFWGAQDIREVNRISDYFRGLLRI